MALECVPQIAVIDDDEAFLELIRDVCVSAGYAVVIAHYPSDAFALGRIRSETGDMPTSRLSASCNRHHRAHCAQPRTKASLHHAQWQGEMRGNLRVRPPHEVSTCCRHKKSRQRGDTDGAGNTGPRYVGHPVHSYRSKVRSIQDYTAGCAGTG